MPKIEASDNSFWAKFFLGNYGAFKLQCACSFNKTNLKKTAQKFSKLKNFCHKPSKLSQYSRDNPEDDSVSSAVVFLYNCFSESILTWLGQYFKTPFELDKYESFEAFSLGTKFLSITV